MNLARPGRAVLGGFIATLVMTIIMYMAPMMGMPKMDIAGMLGSMMSGSMPPPSSAAWWMGMIVHFFLGSVLFSLIYAYLLYSALRGSNWMRGAEWGTVLWLLAQVVVMPMMGSGVFSTHTPAPAMMVMGSLVGHLVYGAILGAISGPQAVRERFRHQERHA